MKKALVLAAAAALALASLGCKPSTLEIKTLLDDPGRYDKQVVAVAGTVNEAIGVLGYGAYEMDDGTGRIMVVTRESGAPRTGAKLWVQGEFRSAYTLGEQTAAVLLEKERRAP